MIKVDIKSSVLKETKDDVVIGIDSHVEVKAPPEILTEEVYALVKQFEKKIPEIWCNVISRLTNDILEGEDKE